MLDLIVQIFSFVKQITYFGLVLSYKTGQLIIYGINTLFQLLVQINNNIGTVLVVLFEDFSVFLYDVGQRVLHAFTIICDIFQRLMNCITTVVETIKLVVLTVVFCVTGTYNAIFAAIAKVFAGLGHVVFAIKYFALLLGSGIWFALTLIPLFIVYTCAMFTYYIGCIIDELVNITSNTITSSKLLINNSYEFITDVPLEAMAGLLAGACIFYVIIKFHILVYRKFLSVVELIRQNTQRVSSRFTRLIIQYREPEPPQQPSSASEQTDSSSDEESNRESDESACDESRLCIICHERLKCMLMLPCRHVCLCNICNVRLRNYNRTCPICRTVVQKTMKVFV